MNIKKGDKVYCIKKFELFASFKKGVIYECINSNPFDVTISDGSGGDYFSFGSHNFSPEVLSEYFIDMTKLRKLKLKELKNE